VAVVATLSKGYDLEYLWKQVDRGPFKDAASYYLQASENGGEPPGRWWGPGAKALGFEQGQTVNRKPYDLPAPRGAVLYRSRSGQRWDELSLDQMANPRPERRRDDSTPGNRWLRPGVGAACRDDPCDMATAGLPESQSPQGVNMRPPERRLLPAPVPSRPGQDHYRAASQMVAGWPRG
jgi:hypothetical protein